MVLINMMKSWIIPTSAAAVTLMLLIVAGLASAESTTDVTATLADKHRGLGQISLERYFRDEVWAKVAESACLKCHNAKGDAQESELILRDLAEAEPKDREAVLRGNLAAFEKVALRMRKDESVLLQKVVGRMAHERQAGAQA